MDRYSPGKPGSAGQSRKRALSGRSLGGEKWGFGRSDDKDEEDSTHSLGLWRSRQVPATGQALPRRHLALSAVQGALLGRDRAQHREDPEVRREMRRPDRTEGEVAGFALGSSRPRSCQRAGSVKRGGREARARLGQGGPLRLRECRVGAQKPVSVLWGIQAKPSARP